LKAQINKTDRNDARGVAQMMRVGLYRPVHVKTLRSQKLRMLLTHRKLLQSKAIAIENDLRATLRNFGLKVGMVGTVNPTNNPVTVEAELRQAQAAAHTLGLQTIHMLQASTEPDLDGVFSTLIQQRVGGLVITADTFFSGKHAEVAALASRHAMPTISPYREFVTAGGLMSYGGSVTELYRLVGVYTGRVLNGDKPADLPVQQVTKVDLVINLKTARALGLEIPPTLLARANEVIE
jgi:ABC-type uncharacterized transport system substrate-binding protein